jgi:hypothetical protein
MADLSEREWGKGVPGDSYRPHSMNNEFLSFLIIPLRPVRFQDILSATVNFCGFWRNIGIAQVLRRTAM